MRGLALVFSRWSFVCERHMCVSSHLFTHGWVIHAIYPDSLVAEIGMAVLNGSVESSSNGDDVDACVSIIGWT